MEGRFWRQSGPVT
ncbi:rCG39001 [Rattus norvegicus]|uniref:RCG39001 n=1 Tax=Rattus norvegicus TaxID=10116 RepID=A6JY09_RAT|nr:rCG39001 [Rattus norvegicus]